MNDSTQLIAQLLAAEEHPHLREDETFVAALNALEASPELQAQFAEAKAFMEKHPVLTRIEGMPQESHDRIEQVLRAQLKKYPEGRVIVLTPWGMRKQFAWAAVLALLLAGMSVISSHIILKNEQVQSRMIVSAPHSPQAAFQEYAGKLAENRLPLQYRENGTHQLVSWLEERGAAPFATPEGLVQRDTMGCAYLDGPTGKVSLICFKTENGTVHLFVTDAKSLELKGETEPQRVIVNHREAFEWHDEVNAYLLMPHDKDQQLPKAVFL